MLYHETDGEVVRARLMAMLNVEELEMTPKMLRFLAIRDPCQMPCGVGPLQHCLIDHVKSLFFNLMLETGLACSLERLEVW